MPAREIDALLERLGPEKRFDLGDSTGSDQVASARVCLSAHTRVAAVTPLAWTATCLA